MFQVLFIFFSAGDGVMVGVQLVIQCKLSKIILQLLLYSGCSVVRGFLFSVSILSFSSLQVYCCVKLILCSVAFMFKVFYSSVMSLSCVLSLFLCSVSPLFGLSFAQTLLCSFSLLFSGSVSSQTCVQSFTRSCLYSLSPTVCPFSSVFGYSCALFLLISVSLVFCLFCVLFLLCSVYSQFISLFFLSLPCSDAPVLVAALPEVLKEDDMSALLSCTVKGEPWPQVNAQIKL